MYTIYVIKELGEIIYVGMTTRALHDRFISHCKINQSPLAEQIKINGRDAYDIIATDHADTRSIAFLKEEFWTRFYSNYHELRNTRIGSRCSEKERLNLKIKLKGRIFSEEHLEHMKEHKPPVDGKNNPMYGKKHSEDTKKLIGSRSYKSISGSNNVHARKVRCITTGLCFDTVKSAGIHYGISDNTIRYIIHNAGKKRSRKGVVSGNGLLWEYC